MNEYYIKVLPDFEKDKSLENKEIIILGFGRKGKRVIDFALSRNYNIVEIWDNYPKVGEYKGIKVCKPHNKQNKNIPIVLSANISDIDKVLYSQAKDLEYINVLNFAELFICENLSYDEYRTFVNEIQRFKIKKLYCDKNDLLSFSHIDLQITEKCSLKCKECTNLMQYYKSPKDIESEEILKDIKQFLSIVDYVEEVRVLGGEPFICKNLHMYIQELKKYSNIGTIVVITNGTIIPMNENLECLKSEKVQVRISDYGILSKNLNSLEQLFIEEHILYDIYFLGEWYECGQIKKHNRNSETNKQILSECTGSLCFTVRNNKFFRCPYIANAWALKAIPNDYIEYVDLYGNDIDIIRQNVKNYISKDVLLACDYCIGKPLVGSSKVPVAEQISKPLEYHKYL